MTPFFTTGWTSGIVGLVMEAMNLTALSGLASVTADFTGDGIPDIVIHMCEDVWTDKDRTGATPGRLLLLRGKGDGSFTDRSNLLTDGGEFNACVRNMKVGDFNGDGAPDFVTSTSYEDGRTIPDPLALAVQQTMYLAKSGRMVRKALGLKTWAHGLEVGDWNGDGRDDILIGGFTAHPGQTTGTALFLQGADGTLERRFMVIDGAAAVLADLDGDGKNELVEVWTDWGDPLKPSGFRVTTIGPDGNLGASVFYPEEYVRDEPCMEWNGDLSTCRIRVDADGKEYIDKGIQLLRVGDLNGDGRDDVVGPRARSVGALSYIEGVLDGNMEGITTLELYSKSGTDLQLMTTKISGWQPPRYGLFDYRLMDWNGDGHLDIFAPSPEVEGQFAQVLLNDGVGNFKAIPRSRLPAVDYPGVADPIDANGDGIMDILLRLAGLDRTWQVVPPISATMFLGTKRFYTGRGFANPALRGVPGFNDEYYLNAHPAVRSLIKKGTYTDALDHYLKVGKAKGWAAFAFHTVVYGSDGPDAIRLRNGNEAAIGSPGRDTYFGGAGSDTFVFNLPTDTGNTAQTRDIILDFATNIDSIDLRGMDANTNVAGKQPFTFLPAANAKFTKVAGQLRWRRENPAGTANDKTIIEGDTNGNGLPNFQIELRGLIPLKATDLLL